MIFSKKKPVQQAKPEVKVVLVESSSLRVDDFRKIPALVTEAQKILASESFKVMLAVLRNDAPHNYGIIVKGSVPTDFVHRVGDIEGYLKCLNNLEAMAVPIEENEMPEPTFEPPETEE